MDVFRDVLVTRPDACPQGCSICEEVCSRDVRKGGPAGIKVLQDSRRERSIITCKQCSEPKCAEICPAGAITREETKGVVRIDEDRCVGCMLCTLACPYGGVVFDIAANKAAKCDTCGGEPRCVQACPTEALRYVQNRPIFEQLCDNSLNKGNYLCPGCTAEMSLRFALRVLGKKAIVTTTSGCATLMAGGMGDDRQTENSATRGLMDNVAAIMTGAMRYYKKIGKEATMMAFVGDGATADIGFQSLSGAAERGEDLLFICYDNEGYMNTGIQRSSTTPYLGWTNTTPVGRVSKGKRQRPKNLPLIMAFHGVPYVATASVAYLEDFANKLKKAQATRHGLSYIHVLAPCVTGWRTRSENAIELARTAVLTNYFPLWEAEEGKFRFTYQPKTIQPITEMTSLAGKFAHLNEEDISDLQRYVNERYNTLKYLVDAEFHMTA